VRVLVTGCAGFIGARVAAMLIERGDEVIGIDSMNNAYDVRLKQWRLKQLSRAPNFRYARVNVVTPLDSEWLFVDGPVDAVVNLAPRAGVRDSVANPAPYYETNVMGTLRLLELCVQHDIPKFVLASSSSVYGDSQGPFKEEAPTDRPMSPYAASKIAAEHLCYVYHELHGLDVTVFRYFTVYGPAGRPDMGIYRFTRWIHEGEPILLYGDGEQKRDFTFVDDVARGTVAGLTHLGFETINLGADHPVTVNCVLDHLARHIGRMPEIQTTPAHAADVPATWADIGVARRLLNWQPETSLECGLEKTSGWYGTNRDWAVNIQTQ